MKSTYIYLLLYVFLTTGVLTNAVDPITTTVVVGLGATLGRTVWNYLRESCTPKWVNYNAKGYCVQILRAWVLLCTYTLYL